MQASDLVARYGIDRAAADTLGSYGFDAERFDDLRGRLARPQRADSDGGEANWVLGTVEPPAADDLTRLPPPGTAERERLAEAGREAIAGSQVGVLLLAGGMATRFGGGVKAMAEVLAGLTFADAKLADLRRLVGEFDCAIPLWLMTSFRSDAALRDWAAASASSTVPIDVAPQCISMRLTLTGDLFRGSDGAVSLYAPGHGDAPWAMHKRGLLGEFARRGGRHLFVTNVDNAAATLDPAVIGAHLAGSRPLTCEVVAGHASGGSPWRVDGHMQIVEAFRLPPGVDPSSSGAANTNSLVADIEVFEAGWPLTWFEVRKQVGGVEVVQFERLIGELSAFVDTTMLVVERDGPDGRFQPVKDPAELEARRPEIARILSGRGIVTRR
ncbi:UTP--glucose-1-phosphate uridylyltransferase [Candidatus Poriferisodalis sp.]|uniref:UTP--glucose-1-phosphate uridylyltransferase n=1 Tax=Candidatus Poriferisodalis sp. TaxID=3101277 RepID=UPI003B01F295